jgi:AraC-like DNA-binding protein
MSTVVAAWTRLIVEHADSVRLPVDGPLRRAGLDRRALDRPDARIGAEVDDAIWSQIAVELGDQDLGLHISQRTVDARSFGLLGFLVRSCPTVADAIRLSARYHHLIKDDGRVAVRSTAQGITISELPAPGRGPWPRHVAETIIGNYVVLGRRWTGEDLVPREVRFQHQRPARTDEHERLFRCPIQFGAEDNAVVWSHEVAGLPFSSSEPELAAHLEPLARARLAEIAQPHAFARDVRLAIAEALTEGDAGADAVARRLGTSVRSLQRRLRQDGVSYRALLDAVRRLRALELVRAGTPLAEVADRLAFSDARAFRRAFRRWTGRPPSALAG